MSKNTFVVGFITGQRNQQVLLIRKHLPIFHRGKLNGLGGKVKRNELPVMAMRREAWEESGIDLPGWIEIGVREGQDYKVHFFTNRGSLNAPLPQPRPGRGANPEETVEWYGIPSGKNYAPVFHCENKVEDVDLCIYHILLIKDHGLRVRPFYITELNYIPQFHAKEAEPLDTIP